MIRTFADETTRDIWNGVNSNAARRIPRELWPNVRRKLDQIDAVTRLAELKVAGNRLHTLVGDLDSHVACCVRISLTIQWSSAQVRLSSRV